MQINFQNTFGYELKHVTRKSKVQQLNASADRATSTKTWQGKEKYVCECHNKRILLFCAAN